MFPAFLAALLLAALWMPLSFAQDARAQANHPAVQRYNRTAKGANVEEWQRNLGADDAKVRLDAVNSLGNAGGEDVVKPLIEATADPDPRVRIRAIDMLGLVGDPAASQVLMQLLFLNNVDKPMKLRVLTALGRIADPRNGQELLQYAKTVGDDDLSCRAIFAVGEIADPESREELEKLRHSTDNPHVKRLCSDAVSKIEARERNAPAEQPTLLELERKLARPQGKH